VFVEGARVGDTFEWEPAEPTDNALTASAVFYVDHENYSATPGELMAIEPGLEVVAGAGIVPVPSQVWVETEDQEVTWAAVDGEGTWWCVTDVAVGPGSETSFGAGHTMGEAIERCSVPSR